MIRDDGSPQPRAESRPHHIAAIAHMFFAEDEAARGVDGPVHDIAVVAADERVDSAPIVADIVRLQADSRPETGRVCIAEDSGGSVLSLLPAASRGDGAPGGAPGLRVTAVRAAEGAEAASCWWRWRHFGGVAEAQLTAWEGATAAPALALGRPAWRALVWCADARTAPHLATLCGLRRLALLLEPRRVEILIVPPDGSASAAAAAAGEVLARLAAALGDVPAAVTPLPAESASPRAGRQAALAAVLGRVTRTAGTPSLR